MIPFPGESVGIDDAYGVDYNTISHRGHNNGPGPASATLNAADEWRTWVYDGSIVYLEAADTTPVVASWVVEVLSGAGTVAASMGMDPGYGDSGAAHPTDLGTHAISGATTLVLPTTLTATDLLSGGSAMMLVLEGISGAVEVQQVKLRVWPTAGVSGGWVNHPEWISDAGTRAHYAQGGPPVPFFYASVEGATAALADEILTAGLADTPPTIKQRVMDTGPLPLNTGTTETLIGYGTLGSSITSFDPHRCTVKVESQPGVVVFWVPTDPGGRGRDGIDFSTLAEGTDFIPPPTEVYRDTETWAQLLGTPSVSIPPTIRTITNHQRLSNIPASAGAYINVTTGEPLPNGSEAAWTLDRDIDWPMAANGAEVAHTAGSDTVADYEVPLPGMTSGDVTFVYVGFAAVRPPYKPAIAPPEPTALENGYANFEFIFDVTGLPGTFHHPPYRVWNPAAAPVHKLRQYNRDDGLGVAPRRAYGGASRNNTGRAYGYT